MAMYTITAPNKQYVGEVGGVAFVKGKAEADLAPHLVAYFTEHGYEVAKKATRSAPAKKADDDKKE